MTPDPSRVSDLEQRLEMLEREHSRLKKRLGDLVGVDKPDFDVAEFQKALTFYLLLFLLPVLLVAGLASPAGLLLKLPRIDLLPGFPLIDFAGINTRHPGMGFGVFAIGGFAVGVVAVGGGAIGLLAIGGGALGVVAMGGGAVGLIAIGGGATGYVAIGGGGAGRYVLAGEGRGTHVFSRKRQDPEAVRLFTRYFPRLKRAFTGPIPVIPVGPEARDPLDNAPSSDHS